MFVDLFEKQMIYARKKMLKYIGKLCRIANRELEVYLLIDARCCRC